MGNYICPFSAILPICAIFCSKLEPVLVNKVWGHSRVRIVSNSTSNYFVSLFSLIHRTSIYTLVLLCVGLIGTTALSVAGVLPWLVMPLQFGGTIVPEGGMYVQIGLTILLLGVCSFIPSYSRVLKLENSHRDFRISMEDVSHAYSACHDADREGYFQLSREFDSIRERFAFLREHPELDSLEPQILELAAQMSLESRNLAETFSVAKVERARSFLKQRQKEIVGFEQSLERARASCFELTALAEKIEDDDIRLGQKRREVEEKLRTTLVELGFELRYRPINAADTPDIPKPTKVVDTNEGRSRVIAMHAGFGPGPAE